MSIHDEQKYPWLIGEKHFIRKAIDAGKKILGICLGSQLIASALGAGVERNKQREIGWFQVKSTNEAKETTWGKILPNDPVLFHWHSDTFKIPDGATKLYSSEACTNQGFTIDKNIVALQFHPEATIGFAKELIKNCGDELDGSKYVQTEKEILGDKSKFNAGNNLIEQILLEMENQNDF